MLGHVPFRIRPWSKPTVQPTVQPPVEPAAPTVDRATLTVGTLAPRLPAADPLGLRVVPLRPASPWPERRARERVLNPFRLFPYRALHLSRLMYADED